MEHNDTLTLFIVDIKYKQSIPPTAFNLFLSLCNVAMILCNVAMIITQQHCDKKRKDRNEMLC